MKFPSLSSTLKLLRPSSEVGRKRANKTKANSNPSKHAEMTLYDKIEEIISIARANFNKQEIIDKFYDLSEIQQQLTVVTLIEHQMIDVLEVILLSKYDLNYLLRGQTPLHYAIKSKNLNLIKLLLKHNVSLELKDIYKETALNCAVRIANIEIITLLLEQGANVNTTASDSSTPLQYAIHQGDIEIVNVLGKYGALLGSSSSIKNI